MLYNIRYGTGAGWRFHVPFPFSGYLRSSRLNFDKIVDFLREQAPDIIGLIEVDIGSYRSGRVNQAERIAAELGGAHVYESKYGTASLAKRVPVLREQGNAFITLHDITASGFHYFEQGVKRLVIELEFENFVIFLVHLSLHYRHRQYQLSDLHTMFTAVTKPMLVAGDFNAFWGSRELDLFMAATNLKNANVDGFPSFPSYSPRQQLDFILHSPEVNIESFRIPNVAHSDHLPLVCDFDVPDAV